MTSGVVRAAGGVLWRPSDDGGVEVAVIHRPRYDDWSLPKGKADAGEHPLACALREVREETGFTAQVGRPLGTSRYLVMANGRPARKRVDWWAMRATSGEFVESREVDRMLWLPPKDALRRIAGSRGTAPLRRFHRTNPRTTTLLLVRNARATSSGSWDGIDEARPLDPRGIEQADALTPLLAAYGPEHIAAAAPVRCVETVSPAAAALGLPVDIEPALAGAAHAGDPSRAHRRVRELLGSTGSAVLCLERQVVCDLVQVLTGRTRVTAGRGSTWAVSLDAEQAVGVEYWAS